MESRIADLEIRFTHQEAAVESLTHQVLEQQRIIEFLRFEVEQLKARLREFSPSPLAPESEETPPPHY